MIIYQIILKKNIVIEDLDKVRGLQGKEFYEELVLKCAKPELKLNSRDVAKFEIEAKLKKYQLILEVCFFFRVFFI